MKVLFYLFAKIIEILFQIISGMLKLFFGFVFKNGKNSKELRVKKLDQIRKKKDIEMNGYIINVKRRIY